MAAGCGTCREEGFQLGQFIGLWWKGHKVVPLSCTIGRVDAILVLLGGKLEGGADPRGDDAAAGFLTLPYDAVTSLPKKSVTIQSKSVKQPSVSCV